MSDGIQFFGSFLATKKNTLPMTKNCKICDAVFEPVRWNAIYCSNKCGQTAFRRKNKNKTQKWSREWKDKKNHGGERERLIKKYGLICSMCGKKSTRSDIHTHHTSFNKTNHENQILVCNSCHGKIHIAENRKKLLPVVCKYCGETFVPNSKLQKYCSATCKGKQGYANKLTNNRVVIRTTPIMEI